MGVHKNRRGSSHNTHKESLSECVSRKIPILKREGKSQGAAVGAAHGICRRRIRGDNG